MDKIGTYRIVRQLGQGGMGVVYEGMNDQISRRVAIKVLHKEVSDNPDLLARFFNEARASNLASHTSIVDVYELGQLPDGRAYIVMQFLAGDSLADRLQQRGGKLPAADAIRLIRQVAAGMAAAHSKGIIHRDLKPDNVMIVEDSEAPGGERAKIVDFGIAKMMVAPEGPGEQRRTRAGTVLGTPAYMAPEQCRGSEGLTPKADVYALGVMLYECLAGRTPFLATGTGEMLAKHIYEQPQPLWELDASQPAELVSLVHAMLHKQPESRPTMTEVVAHLTALGAPATAESPIVRLPPVGPVARGAAVSRQTEALSPGAAAAPPSPRLAATPLPEPVQSPPPRPTGRPLPIYLGTALIVALAIFGGVRFLRPAGSRISAPDAETPRAMPKDDRPDKKPSSAPAEGSKPPPILTVHWSIVTQPAGAQVMDAVSQQALGVTPLEQDRPAATGLQLLLLRLPGHQDHTLRLLGDRSESRRVSLVPLEPSPSSPEPTAKTDKSRRGSKPGKTVKSRTAGSASTPMTDDDVKVVQ